jgi:hypothetical protein
MGQNFGRARDPFVAKCDERFPVDDFAPGEARYIAAYYNNGFPTIMPTLQEGG